MARLPTDLLHIGVVVRDARASAAEYSRIHGIRTWSVTDHGPDTVRDATTHGFASAPAFRIASGSVDSPNGTVSFQLIEPTGGWSVYEEFRQTRGQGVQHLCLGRLPPAEWEALSAWLGREGVGVAQEYRVGEERHILLETRRTLGFDVALVVAEEGASMPAAGDTWDMSGEIDAGGAMLPIGTFQIHFGVVVRDLMERMEDYRRLFGIEEAVFMTWDSRDTLEAPTNMGQPVDHAYFTTLLTLSDTLALEVIQPTRGPSNYKEQFLQQTGEGIHHVNLTGFPDAAGCEAACTRAGAANSPMVMSGGVGDGFAYFYYVDTSAQLGYVTEVTHPGPNFAAGPGAMRPAMIARFADAVAA